MIRRRSKLPSVVRRSSRYEHALQRLREPDRESIIARVELGLDYREIADLLGRPSVGAVRVASAAPCSDLPRRWAMSDQPDDAWLIALGRDVSDGGTVDWDLADRRADDDDADALVDRTSSGSRASCRRIAHPAARRAMPPHRHRRGRAGHWQHFVLFESVGAGAFGTVYRGWDTKVDREVAVKLVSAGATNRSPLSEARNLARIRHPNIVTVYGAEQDDEQVAIWMEFIQGETLVQMVRDRGPMSAREVVGIGVDLCRALSALQGAWLLHRDIKAHNVMREVGGRIVLMDFSGAWTSDAT